MSKFLNISTDNTLGGDSASDDTVASQKAVKDYIDNRPVLTVDQTYDGTSTNAQSGVAVASVISSLNSAVVHKTGNELIMGNKVFGGQGFPTLSIISGNGTLQMDSSSAHCTLSVANGSFQQNGNKILNVTDVDGTTVSLNSSNQLKAIGVTDSRDSSTAIKTWTGTLAEYNAIATKDTNTLYNITDDTDVSLPILEALYPVGSIYITTAKTCPLSTLISGSTWIEETSRVLIEKQLPTSANGYTWYNLYSDGWCEQGGSGNFAGGTTVSENVTVSLPKTYSNDRYTVSGILGNGNNYARSTFVIQKENTSTIYVQYYDVNGTSLQRAAFQYNWKTSGYTSTTTSHKQFRRTA